MEQRISLNLMQNELQRFNKQSDLVLSKKITDLKDNEYKLFLHACCEELRIGLQKEQDMDQVKRLIAFMEEKNWTPERAIKQIKTALETATFYNQTWTYKTILEATETPVKKEMVKPELVFFYNKTEKNVCTWDINYSGKCPFPNIPFLEYMNNLDKRKEYDEYLGVPESKALPFNQESEFENFLKQNQIYKDIPEDLKSTVNIIKIEGRNYYSPIHKQNQVDKMYNEFLTNFKKVI